MFERYTERARRIIFFARYEASQFGSPSIESEHLLLGMLRESGSLAANILLERQVNIQPVRAAANSTKSAPTPSQSPSSPSSSSPMRA